VHDPHGFDLALHPVADHSASAGFLHFGFAMDDADAVRALHQRMELDRVPVVEEDDEPDLVSFKCLDPDGWRVEVYRERR